MLNSPELDAILISDSGIDTLSGTNPLKLHVEGRVGAVQIISNYIKNKGRISDPVTGDNQFSWSSAPKLNGLFLYSFLARNNIRIGLIHNYRNQREYFSKLLDQRPKAVIISTTFIFFKHTLRELTADIRSLDPNIFIIAGGPFVYYSSLLLKKSHQQKYETDAAAKDFLFLEVEDEPDIDLYIVSPRGEKTLLTVLNSLTGGRVPASIPETARLEGNSFSFTQRTGTMVVPVGNMEIDWQMLPQSIFETGVIPIQASNGCPYNCSFCNFTKDRRLSFVKPLDCLISELRSVEKRGIKYVWFVDDNFRMGRNDLDKVSRRFIKNDIGVKWMCFIRAGALKNISMDLLQKAGCMEVQIGLESGDAQILENMNKQADPAMYVEVIGKVLRQGINVSCYFISGFPGETEETAATTRQFIRSIENPDVPGSLSWSIYPFLLTPLSPIYEPEMRQKYALHGYMSNWSHHTMDYRQAKKLVLKAFMELENSGPIYREDNLEDLARLTPAGKKKFFRVRHQLAKKSLQEQLTQEDISRSFKEILE